MAIVRQSKLRIIRVMRHIREGRRSRTRSPQGIAELRIASYYASYIYTTAKSDSLQAVAFLFCGRK